MSSNPLNNVDTLGDDPMDIDINNLMGTNIDDPKDVDNADDKDEDMIGIGKELIEKYASDASVLKEIKRLYAKEAAKTQNKADKIAAEIRQRQDKLNLINDIISDINNYTNDQNGLDLSAHPDLVEKLRIAKELGINIKDGQTAYSAKERDHLVENLYLSTDGMDKENRHQTQMMEKLLKHTDRLMVIMDDIKKKEEQAIRAMNSGIKH